MNQNSEQHQSIEAVSIEHEMQKSYLDYAMSVIVSRALPDVRDGLKPVHRRILYAMLEGGNHYNRPFRKSANIVGNVMANYHPHGNDPIYEAMVRMAQDFSMRLPLVHGQGNFGSMDGDRPAAMRYTEAKLQKVAHDLLNDLDKQTVDFAPNYDESKKEPVVLPAKFPNLLVNGTGGIAVGMATNILPHNLGEVIDATCALIDNRDLTIDELMEYIKGPDFPTGGIILGRSGIHSAFHTGRGSIVVRAKTDFEEIRKGRQAIVVSEIPYQVNKLRLIEKIASLVQAKTIEGISDIRDESNREGVRIVVELKRDAEPHVVLNQLFHFTTLQTSYGVNSLALNGGKPEVMNIKDILSAFIDFREEVVRRRTLYELNKARNKAHLLLGLAIAVANIDPVVQMIRNAKDSESARHALMNEKWPAETVRPLIELVEPDVLDKPRSKGPDGKLVYQLSEKQARAILDLRLHRLTGLEREKIANDLKDLAASIKEFLSILGSMEKLRGIIKDEMTAIRDAFATPRRSDIEDVELTRDIEDLIKKEDMVVTVTHTGYIKRVPLSAYRSQKRGGKGRSGMSTHEEDFVTRVLMVNTHTPLLFFSSKGRVYKLKVYKLPQATPQARGKPVVNLLPLDKDEKITTLLPLDFDENDLEQHSIVFATQQGYVRRNALSDFVKIQSNGKIAMKLNDDDQLVDVLIAEDDDDVMLSTHHGKCIRFPIESLRVFFSRSSVGVRGIKLLDKDRVISMELLKHVKFTIEDRDSYLRYAAAKRRREKIDSPLSADQVKSFTESEQFILAVTENGFGKQSSAYEYRVTNRAGQGIINIDTAKRNGKVVSSRLVSEDNHIILVTDKGQIIRFPAKDIRVTGRGSMGVTLFKVAKGEHVVSVTVLDHTEEEIEEAEVKAAASEDKQ